MNKKITRNKLIITAIAIICVGAGVFTMLNRAQQAEAGWWDDSWLYRKSIGITYSGSSTLTEYQVLIDGLDTAALVTAGKMQSDCDDIRFTSYNGTILDYSIVGNTCNTSDTEIWVKTNTIPASDITVYLYYGNPSAISYQSELKTFSYSNEKTVGYVLNTYITSMDLISLEDDNSVTHNGVTRTLGAFETSSFSSIDDYGDVKAKKLFEMKNTTASDMIVPVSWAGTEFIYSNRSSAYDFNITMVSPWGSASVDIYVDGVVCGSTRTVTNTGYRETNCGNLAYDVVRIVSDIPILANKTDSDGDDPFPMHPASVGPWYGWDSTLYFVKSGPSGADYRWIDSNDGSETNPSDLGANTYINISASGGSYYSGETVRTRSVNNVISGQTNGDSDGGDGTTHILRRDFGTKFGSPYSTDFIAVVSDQQTTCRTYNSFGSLYQTQTLESANSLVFGLPASTFGTGNSSNYLSGKWRIECDDPVYVVSQYTEDEQNMFSYPMMRQFTYPTPTVGSPGSEEKGPGPVGYWSFDEGYGDTAYDSTDNGNNGDLAGSCPGGATCPTWQTEDMCVSGKCLKFDGDDDYVDCGNDPSLQINDVFTVEFWVSIIDLTDSHELVSKGQGLGSPGNRGWAISYAASSKRIFFDTYESNGTRHDLRVSYPQNHDWHHIACTFDNGDTTCFIDGSTSSSEHEGPYQIGNMGYSLRISESSQWPAFNGTIDEVRIYPYARSAAQIKKDYNAGLAGMGGGSEGLGAALGGGGSQKWMSDGLVGFWKMDEASWTGVADEVVDASGAGNHGVRAGDATTAAGKFGKGGTFDGTGDYVNCGTGTSLNITDAITISAWVKPDTIVGIHGITGRHTGGGDASGTVRISSANVEVIINIGGSYTSFITTNSPITANQWHHVVYFYNGSDEYIYVNGVEKATRANSGVIYTPAPHNYIGATHGPAQQNFSGLIDQVRIYNRALSPKEVRDLYNFAPGPYVHLPLNEHTGTVTVYDHSSYSNNGTIGDSITESDWVSGKYGTALKFEGNSNDKVTGSISPAIYAEGDYTQELWFYPTSASAGCLIDDWNNAEHYILMNSDRTVKVNYYDGSHVSAQTTYQVPLNQWTHVAGVIESGDSIKIYINGVLKATNDSLGGIETRILNDYILGQYGGGSNRFYGYIDDVRIYNYARSVKQITQDLNAGHPATGSPVGSAVAHWKFDEGYGDTANDSSPQDNDGDLAGACPGAATCPSWTNNGKLGKALSFDGVVSSGDYMNLTSNHVIDLTSATVSFWSKRNVLATTQDGTNTRGALRILRHSNYLSFLDQHVNDTYFQFSGERDVNSEYWAGITSGVVADTEWHHFILTADNNVFKLYIDGKYEGMDDDSSIGNTSNTCTVSSIAMGFGSAHAHYGSYFDGFIDEMKFYNYALTEDEVRVEYNQGKAIVLGATGTESDGKTPSFSANREYCVPGDSTSCDPPVAEWNFNEQTGSSAFDTSANNNTGTITDATWKSAGDCKYGSCLDFDGDGDYVDCGNNSSLTSLTYPFTVEFWYKPSRIVTESGVIIGLPVVASIRFDTNTDHLDCGPSGNRMGLNRSEFYNGVWSHVAVAYIASNDIKVYHNGVDKTINTGDYWSPSANMEIGSRLGGANCVAGSIDHVKIYDYARTPAQVAWSYNRGKPVAEWRFDECQGTTAHDESGNGNTGTINIQGTGSQTSVGTCTDGLSTSAWYNGVDGKINSAMSFDGTDDYVNCGTGSSLQMGTGIITVEAWINVPTWPTAAYGEIFFGGATGAGHGYGIMLYKNVPGRIFYEIYGTSGGRQSYTPNIGVSTGNWNHIVAIFNGVDNYMKVYRDGVEKHSVDISDPGTVTSGAFYIGAHSPTAYNFTGSIDEVKIYNYALTAEQVRMGYNAGAVNFK